MDVLGTIGFIIKIFTNELMLGREPDPYFVNPSTTFDEIVKENYAAYKRRETPLDILFTTFLVSLYIC